MIATQNCFHQDFFSLDSKKKQLKGKRRTTQYFYSCVLEFDHLSHHRFHPFLKKIKSNHEGVECVENNLFGPGFQSRQNDHHREFQKISREFLFFMDETTKKERKEQKGKQDSPALTRHDNAFMKTNIDDSRSLSCS